MPDQLTGDGVARATPASGSSERFNVGGGRIVPELAMRYKCLKGLPTLFLEPEPGRMYCLSLGCFGSC